MEAPLPSDFEAFNKFAVGVGDDVGGKGALVSLVLGRRFTRADALNLVAWLATLADPPLSAEEIAAARRAIGT